MKSLEGIDQEIMNMRLMDLGFRIAQNAPPMEAEKAEELLRVVRDAVGEWLVHNQRHFNVLQSMAICSINFLRFSAATYLLAKQGTENLDLLTKHVKRDPKTEN